MRITILAMLAALGTLAGCSSDETQSPSGPSGATQNSTYSKVSPLKAKPEFILEYSHGRLPYFSCGTSCYNPAGTLVTTCPKGYSVIAGGYVASGSISALPEILSDGPKSSAKGWEIAGWGNGALYSVEATCHNNAD